MNYAEALAKASIITAEAAEVYWMVRYTDEEVDEATAEQWLEVVYGREADDDDREAARRMALAAVEEIKRGL